MSSEGISRDDREVPLPLGYEHLADYGIKAIKYNETVFLEGRDYTPMISNEIREKINKEQSVVIIFTGPPGSGKTYGVGVVNGMDCAQNRRRGDPCSFFSFYR